MRQGIQSLMTGIGGQGCYALCIIELAEKITKSFFDPAAMFERAVNLGYIRYRFDNPKWSDGCFVTAPDRFLSTLIGKKVTLRKEYNINYIPKPNEWIIIAWEKPGTNSTLTHFTLPDWDPIEPKISTVCLQGHKTSLRVFSVN
ncbi:hypothetical protein FACS1894164_11080 [Spirochaetia bacterium]|nr:hypothetical protein FACS1894164_11080 [Spirochaetia bacterium]